MYVLVIFGYILVVHKFTVCLKNNRTDVTKTLSASSVNKIGNHLTFYESDFQ